MSKTAAGWYWTVRMVSLILSCRYPGKFAMYVLAGAIEAQAELSDVRLHFPRDLASLEADTRAAIARGDQVIVAWSSYSPGFPECIAELRHLRSAIDAPFLAIAGGPHATAEPWDALKGGFDLICIGEGERALVELLRRAKAGADLTSTPGFARLEGSRVVQTPKAERLADLDEFPPFAASHGRFGAIEITRGCIFACRFCQTPYFSKARFRHRSIANIAHHAGVLVRSGKPDVRFISPTSLSYGSQDESVNLAAVEELLARIRESVGAQGRIYFGTFPSEVRPEHVTPEALAVLKRYVNNDNLIIGGQSGSERILESSKRGHDVESIVRATRIAAEAGFVPNVDFILGLPGEAPEDVRATVALMKQLAALGAKVHGHSFMPLPGTPFRDAPAASIDDETRVELERLASQQKLYGQWKVQLEVARRLTERRDSADARGYGTSSS